MTNIFAITSLFWLVSRVFSCQVYEIFHSTVFTELIQAGAFIKDVQGDTISDKAICKSYVPKNESYAMCLR